MMNPNAYGTYRPNVNNGTSAEVITLSRYELTMKNVRPFMFDDDGRMIMAATDVAIDLLTTDDKYQGYRNHPRIQRLIDKWNPLKLTPITVVPHPEEEKLYVVDGKGRLMAAIVKGIKSLPAIILLTAPKNPEERLKYEAEFFAGQGTEVEKLTAVEKHLADCIAGVPEALIVDKAMKKYGFEIKSTRGSRGKGVAGSYNEMRRAAKLHPECLDYCCSIIQNCKWDIEANGYSKSIMYSLGQMFCYYEEYRGEIYNYLCKQLVKISPSLFIADARSAYKMRGEIKVAVTAYLEDMICKALKIDRKIYDGNGERKKSLTTVK